MVVGDETVAVNFTDTPAVEGFFDDTIVVVVVAWLTVCEVVPELVADWASPVYVAVMVSVPEGIFAVLSVATPPLKVAVPKLVVPFRNFTFPVGPPGALEFTVADNCTVWPNVDGFKAEVTLVVLVYRVTTCVTAPVLVLYIASPA
jgi:hypothetical protein